MGAWRTAFVESRLFGSFEGAVFEHAERYDATRLSALVESIRFIAALDEAERAPVVERARNLAGGGDVDLRFRCEVQVTTRRG